MTTAVESERVRYRTALVIPEFRALFTAYSISTLGSVSLTVALTVLVYQRTGSPVLSALAFALGFLPYIVSGLLLSALVDRLPPRRLLVASDVTCALLVLAMAWSRMPIGVVLGLLFVVGGITSISGGTRNATVRAVVGDAAFIPARSLLRISAQSAQVVGNGVGGLLLIVLAPRSLILVDAVSFALSALITRARLQERPPAALTRSSPLLLDSLRGFGAIVREPEIRRILLFGWLLPPFSVVPEALAAPYVLGSGYSRAVVGWWLVALPVGVISGDLVGVWFLTPSRQRRYVAAIAAVGFVPYLAFAARPSVAVAIPLLVVSGFGSGYFLGLDGLLRDAVPPTLFPRTMAINSAGLMTIQGLGFAAAGAVAEVVSPATAIAGAGVLGLSAIALLRPRT